MYMVILKKEKKVICPAQKCTVVLTLSLKAHFKREVTEWVT